jgi:hypothetical protein
MRLHLLKARDNGGIAVEPGEMISTLSSHVDSQAVGCAALAGMPFLVWRGQVEEGAHYEQVN